MRTITKFMASQLFGPLVACVACVVLAACTAKPQAKPDELASRAAAVKTPNIVVVLVDDMRWDEFGAAGHNYIETPSIDRLAAEGVRFTAAFASTPLCSPSRASFLTGQYAHTNGITDNLARDAQSHELPNFARKLDALGYDTAFIGKWHMGNDDSPRPGFDRWVGLRGQGEINDPQLNIDGTRETVPGYTTDVLTNYAIEFVRKSREQPFLLYLSHKALHPNLIQRDDGSVANIGSGGFVPAPRHKGKYADKVFQRRANSGIAPTDKPALMRPIAGKLPLGPETVTPEATIRERAEMLLAVDDGLGKLYAALSESHQLADTLFVFTSDHGYWYGEHGLSDERRLAYEEGIRIPLVIRYPGKIKAGTTQNAMVLSLDLAPTVLELAGAPPDAALQGRSLSPLFAGNTQDWRDSVLIEYYSDTVFERIVNMGYKAVRTSRHKYIQYQDLEGMDELYDLESDPFELKNLIAEASAQATLADMKTELSRLVAAAR